ncbi:hypothetical protein BDU57DRAFT_530692 [Ampelomyces quisqualis]|uniref:MARVEL domain-containing protein n=1 Tax=Ampelomyces quisqualis TaxID=50730 RepID=A0A6A5QFK9_AMPQU|nr:hypothetical protein BDU57DRAFT_530692 [Ampelomyces quisqualis]
MTPSRTNTDYGTPAARANRLLRHAVIANHILHLSSSVIVMSIAAYFIANFNHNTHIVYWVSIAAIDCLLYLVALSLPFLNTHTSYLALLACLFSYLWLTAFIFAAQDYEYGSCALRSPTFVDKCSVKRTLEAFAFIAFFTSLLGTLLETRLWHGPRFGNTAARHANGFDAEKQHRAPAVVPGRTAAHATSAV